MLKRSNVNITKAAYVTLLSIILIGLSSQVYAQSQDLINYVQPFSGTSASTTVASQHIEDKTERLANTIPAVAPPFAMTQWTPQTQLSEKKCLAPYYYNDTRIYGFRATHWISGSCTQDYGSFSIMPISGKLKTESSAYAEEYSHTAEIARPDYYKVIFPTYQLQTEISATLRSGIMRITALKADSVYILITPNSDLGKGFIKIDREKGEIIVNVYSALRVGFNDWGENRRHVLQILKALDERFNQVVDG